MPNNREPCRKLAKLQRLSGALIAVSLILYLLLLSDKDGLIIRYGIRGYRAISSMIRAVLAACLAFFATIAIFRLSRKRRQKKQEAKTEPEPRPQPTLSIKDLLNSRQLHGILTEYANKPSFTPLWPLLRECAGQLDTMDEYQEKLAKLLDTNGVYHLSDTSDVLDKVEQYLCRNIRKVINYIEVSDEDNEADMQMITTKLTACNQDCARQLDKVREFLFVMADFLNKQGEDDTAPEMLDMYKTSILESIKEE